MSQKEDMMKCDDYKTAVSADPGFKDESGHADSCASCRQYQSEILALNEKIALAMELDVPPLAMPDLPIIDSEKVTSLVARLKVSKVTWFALAATVVMGVFLGLRVSEMDAVYGTLGEQVLAHVDHEPGALKVSATPVSDSHLARAVPEDLATMNHDVGLITYAQSCMINGKTVPHLVIQGERGPITILLMPDEKLAESQSLEGVNVRGVILPVGDGSIAIIGVREEQLDRVQQNILDSVNWST
jgi:hypothetical protein